ncbi:hypothetical protein BKA61DRAFT_597249 [Leptodontidium sp. MPI-SDFR-AT-0119]|nr:hypothetical protein BKA61DRAFT_597249 [Leptodontidium sp. MPI-SDFR-AT-0119]
MMLSFLSYITTTGVIWASFVVASVDVEYQLSSTLQGVITIVHGLFKSSSTLCDGITRFGSRRSINSIVIVFGFFVRALYVLGSSKTQLLHSIRSSFPFAFAFGPSSSRCWRRSLIPFNCLPNSVKFDFSLCHGFPCVVQEPQVCN